MLDESVLETPEALVRADTRDLLRATAEAGARVRSGIRRAADAGVTALRPEGRPRAVLVAGPGPSAECLADLLAALTRGAVPVTAIRPTGTHAAPGALRWALPGWAGPVDLLLVATHDGAEPGLAALVEQAYRRGCSVVAVTPPSGPLAAAVGETRGLTVPPAPAPYAESRQPQPAPSGALWALLTPLLLLCDRLGLTGAEEPALQSLADRLDTTAERCGPAVPLDENPAKTLALELSDAVPLLWSEGDIAAAAARHAAATLTSLAGVPALTARLPEAPVLHEALLAAGSAADAEDDIFRDRVEDPGLRRARVVLLADGTVPADGQASSVAREAAHSHRTPVSDISAGEDSGPLHAAAELIATVDFAAVYLVLATGDA